MILEFPNGEKVSILGYPGATTFYEDEDGFHEDTIKWMIYYPEEVIEYFTENFCFYESQNHVDDLHIFFTSEGREEYIKTGKILDERSIYKDEVVATSEVDIGEVLYAPDIETKKVLSGKVKVIFLNKDDVSYSLEGESSRTPVNPILGETVFRDKKCAEVQLEKDLEELAKGGLKRVELVNGRCMKIVEYVKVKNG